MRRFGANKSRGLLQYLAPLAMSAAVLVFFLIGILSVYRSNTERQKDALEKALMRNITACYATEGRYPESLAYLKEKSGLSYDEKTFFVDYIVRGSNLRPEVTIIERKEAS